ncbi:MAG: hemagglutinin [Bacteroidota bacterium]
MVSAIKSTVKTKSAKTVIAKTGTIWDDILATQGNYLGSVLPKSFQLATQNGTKVWVHGNATKHLAEFAKLKAINYTPEAVRLSTQQQLRSLQSAVNVATKNGVPYNSLLKIGGWELKFGAARGAGKLPTLFHALPLY